MVSTPYCPACGERPLTENDLTLRSLFNQLFHAFSSIDSRLIRSFRNLLRHPGLLTAAYVRGQRMPYTGPFQLFLIANILFFAMQSLTNTNIVSSQLDSHLHNQDWSALAQRLVSHRLEEVQTTVDFYAPIFNQAVVLNAKSLIILMVVPFTLLLPVLFYRARRPFVAHIVFSLHLYTFLLLLFCVSLAIAAIDVLFGGAGLNSAAMDNIVGFQPDSLRSVSVHSHRQCLWREWHDSSRQDCHTRSGRSRYLIRLSLCNFPDYAVQHIATKK